MNVAILDDYQNVALKMADWSSVARRAKITVFNDHAPIRMRSSKGCCRST
jgi:hypothetical protein